MFFKENMILFIFPKDPVLLCCPTGFPVKAELSGEEFMKQSISFWKLDPENEYRFVLLREGEQKVLDLQKSVGENGLRHGDAIRIEAV